MIFIVVKHPVRPEHADEWMNVVAPFTEATRPSPAIWGATGRAAPGAS